MLRLTSLLPRLLGRRANFMAINGSRNLSSGGLDDDQLETGGSPMESLGNLMDVMLVFACGLIIALVARYGVQLVGGSEEQENMQEITSQVEEASSAEADKKGQYDEIGSVYRDKETGKLYVVENSGGSSSSSNSSDAGK